MQCIANLCSIKHLFSFLFFFCIFFCFNFFSREHTASRDIKSLFGERERYTYPVTRKGGKTLIFELLLLLPRSYRDDWGVYEHISCIRTRVFHHVTCLFSFRRLIFSFILLFIYSVFFHHFNYVDADFVPFGLNQISYKKIKKKNKIKTNERWILITSYTRVEWWGGGGV